MTIRSSLSRAAGCSPRRRAAPALLAAAAAAALAGCSFVPTYQRPDAPIAAQWPESAGAQAEGGVAAADLPWQQFVQEPQLRELIAQGLENNRDLRVAIQNIERARALYQITRADQFPTVGVNANGTRSAPNAYQAVGGGSVASQYSVGLGVSAWELDFFGRVAALKDAALANYLATEEARKSAQISLVAAIATTWLQLKSDTELVGLAERTLGTRQQSLRLTRLRFDNGVSSALDLRQAETLTSSALATRAQQMRLRAQDINALTLLVGQPIEPRLIPPLPSVAPAAQPAAPRPVAAARTAAMPPVAPANAAQSSAVPASTAPLPGFAEVPAGLPSDLLLRRPDIRAAEQQLVAANANIGAARAAMFPRITLTASLGRVSGDLDGLVGSGGVKAWSFGPSLYLPIFDMGRNRANLEANLAAREIAVAQYQKAIQTAFREVADALAGRATYADQVSALEAQAAAERDRLRLADLRYRNGIATYLDQLDAERSLFAIEQTLAQARLAQRANDVQLYRALGGGWSEPEGAFAAAPAPAATAPVATSTPVVVTPPTGAALAPAAR